MALLHHTVVKSQSSLQTGAEHEISIWREGQSNYHSAVLPERMQKTRKSGGEQTNKTPENSSNMKNPGEQNNQRQAEEPMVLRPATSQDNSTLCCLGNRAAGTALQLFPGWDVLPLPMEHPQLPTLRLARAPCSAAL